MGLWVSCTSCSLLTTANTECDCAPAVLFDHFGGLSYHCLSHAAEALKRFTDNLHAGIILTDRVCRQDSRDQFPNTADTAMGTELVYSASLVLLPPYSGIQLCVPGWTHCWKTRGMRVLCTSTPYGLSWEAISLNSGPQCSQKMAPSERFLQTQETLGLLCVHQWTVHVSVCSPTAAMPLLSYTTGAQAGRSFGSLLCLKQNLLCSTTIMSDAYFNFFWQNHQGRHVVLWQDKC